MCIGEQGIELLSQRNLREWQHPIGRGKIGETGRSMREQGVAGGRDDRRPILEQSMGYEIGDGGSGPQTADDGVDFTGTQTRLEPFIPADIDGDTGIAIAVENAVDGARQKHRQGEGQGPDAQASIAATRQKADFLEPLVDFGQRQAHGLDHRPSA